MSDEKKILMADGSEASVPEEENVNRAKEKKQEDKNFVPVIIKRNDESIKHPYDILERATSEGLEQHRRSKKSLFLSAVAAGLILGFAAMLVGLASEMVPAINGPLYNRLAMAIVYPLGFIICILSRTQLFTEHTATAVYPFLDGKVPFRSLHILWITVLGGNLVGTFCSTLLIYIAEPVIGAKDGLLSVFEHLIHFSFLEIFISAILAGWLMAQASWLILATATAIGQIFCIYIATFIIGMGGLHHSIAGSAEIFAGLLHSVTPDYRGAASALLSAILGNLLGGSLFVGVLNYGHIKKSQ
ncbi:MAG: formate/nitrite transporter family protein [Bacteriovoracaceae bacterium]